jgi:hypothetical protein
MSKNYQERKAFLYHGNRNASPGKSPEISQLQSDFKRRFLFFRSFNVALDIPGEFPGFSVSI